jgi:peptidoglycan/xylan/chitin deacetylase (PgdA/CDA1 family)
MSAMEAADPRSVHPLVRLLSPLDDIAPDDDSWATEDVGDARVRCLAGAGEPEWLTRGSWRLFVRPSGVPTAGERLTGFARADGEELPCVRGEDGNVTLPFGLADALTAYTSEAWTRRAGRRLSPALLNAFYRVKRAIPRSFQLAGRRSLIRWQGLPEFPAWPADSSVADLLRFWIRCELTARDLHEIRFRWFWPGRSQAALILTHDVESEAGLRNAARIADLEQERGLRSSFNVVAEDYPIDWGIVEELRSRGFELGVHGVHHDRSMFSSRESFVAQQPALERMADRLGADGFRSPATHRVHDWLEELPVAYDCTVPMSDPYEPQPGGCCSPWPYFLGDVVELPWTLPQDHTTFTLLRERSIGLWMKQLGWLEREAGLVQCLSHPDPGYLGDGDKEALYVEFLDAVASRPGLWKALPREVAAWWRGRDLGTANGPSGSEGVASMDGSGRVRLGLATPGVYENQSAPTVREAPADR